MESYLMITGATGGLGRAMSVECARRGYNLFLTDRGQNGEWFSRRLSETFGIEAVYRPCDLVSIQSRTDFFGQLRSQGSRFWGLINVAGTDYEGAFLEKTREQILQIVQLNLVATLDVTHTVLGLRDPDRRFMLINVCSLAGFFPMPYKATYAASKRFLLDFSRALREEIREYGSVTALCPGGLPTTPDTMRAIFAQGFWGKMTTLDTALVARRTLDHALKGHAVYIPGFINQTLHSLGSMAPVGWVARSIGKRWKTAQSEANLWNIPPVQGEQEELISAI